MDDDLDEAAIDRLLGELGIQLPAIELQRELLTELLEPDTAAVVAAPEAFSWQSPPAPST
jgi:hypothetical protein